jgi:hypothetical protein
MSLDIHPDEFYPINLTHPDGSIERTIPVSAKYDRVDFYEPLGLYMMKLYDDEVGLVCAFVDQDSAMRAIAEAELPLVNRDFIYESEYNGYLEAQESHITDEEFELDIDEASIIEAVAREKADE